jgi:hypothetical protein
LKLSGVRGLYSFGKPADAKNIYESIQEKFPESSEPGKLTLQRHNLIEEQFKRMKK